MSEVNQDLKLMLSLELSDWQCYMFGNRPGGNGLVYRPQMGRVPNAFVRFMMRVCFDCVWVRLK